MTVQHRGLVTVGELDPITLEIGWNRLIMVMDEVDVTLVRTSFSSIVGESRDFGCILLDEEGRSLAQSRLSSPTFTCMMPVTTKHLLARFGRNNIEPGDVLLTNDPWIGTGHLPDLTIVTPVFHDGELAAFIGTAAHIADIGGRLDFFDARDIYEEGLQIPPCKLFKAGTPNHDILDIIAANVRVPGMVLGDIYAIIGSHKVGMDRMRLVFRDYGLSGFRSLGSEILGRSERAMSEAIAGLPDGQYTYTHYADGWRRPVRIDCKIEIRGDRLHVDYTGSSDQRPDASVNCPTNTTYADTIYPIKCSLVPDVPNNEGLFWPVTAHAPEGSILNPTFPCPVKSRSKTSSHLHMAVYGALETAMPERVQSGSGCFWAVTFHGQDERGETFNLHVLPYGGKGATVRADGLNTIAFPYNGTVTPVEIVENTAPVRVEKKEFLCDSAGAGRHRGGMAQRLEVRSLGEGTTHIVVRPDKVRFPAPGALGGKPGRPGSFTINGEPGGADPHPLARGVLVTVDLPGAGGYGDPLERDPEAVLRDVRFGLVSEEAASEEYGVVIVDGEVDQAETKALRESVASARGCSQGG